MPQTHCRYSCVLPYNNRGPMIYGPNTPSPGRYRSICETEPSQIALGFPPSRLDNVVYAYTIAYIDTVMGLADFGGLSGAHVRLHHDVCARLGMGGVV